MRLRRPKGRTGRLGEPPERGSVPETGTKRPAAQKGSPPVIWIPDESGVRVAASCGSAAVESSLPARSLYERRGCRIMALRLWASRLQAASLPKVSFGEVMEGLCAPCLLAGKQLAHHHDVVFVQAGDDGLAVRV